MAYKCQSSYTHTHAHQITGPVLPKQLGRVYQEIIILRLGSGQFLLVMLWSIRRSDAGLPPNGVLHCEREGMRAHTLIHKHTHTHIHKYRRAGMADMVAGGLLKVTGEG